MPVDDLYVTRRNLGCVFIRSGTAKWLSVGMRRRPRDPPRGLQDQPARTRCSKRWCIDLNDRCVFTKVYIRCGFSEARS